MLKAANSSVRFLAEPIPTTYSPWRQHFYTDPLPAKKWADGIFEGLPYIKFGWGLTKKTFIHIFNID